jgi:hypothetical protein
LPDYTIAQRAKDLYHEFEAPNEDQPSLRCWIELLDDLLRGKTKVVVVVDALDAAITDPEANMFLDQMRRFLAKYPQVCLLCSSREHIHVDMFVGPELLHWYGMKAASTRSDMRNFIAKKIEFRRLYLEKSSTSCILSAPVKKMSVTC